MKTLSLTFSALLSTAAILIAEEAAPREDGDSRANLEIIRAAEKVETVQPFTKAELGLETPRATALRTVHYTLRLNPQVDLQKSDVEEQRGRVREQYGPFDTHVTGRIAPRAEYNTRETRYRDQGKAAPQPTPLPNPLRFRQGVGDYELGVSKRLANGIVINPTVGLGHRGESDYGGSFEDDLRGALGFQIIIPLGKGAGRQANLAPLEASRFDLLASTLQLRHITSQSVATALRAYWATKAAEETYALRLESEAISARLLQQGVELAKGDEVPPMELAQMIADRHLTIALRVRSEAALIAARQEMATAVGLPGSALLMSPLPQDEFPEPPRVLRLPKLSDLIELALNLRDDLRATRQTAASRKVLVGAAYLNLRPTIDLRLGGSYAPFETRNTSTITDGHHWQGGAELVLDWPVENNAAKGGVIQSEARYQSSLISVEDAERVITSQVITALAELKSAAQNVTLFREAVEWYRRALTAQEELFALGQGNLSDTITARQRLIDAQINSLAARQNYASSLVQLRFACGLLLFSDETGSWVDPESWRQIPLSKIKR